MRRVSELNTGFRRRVLYPAKRWLVHEHVAAIMLLLYALSLFFMGSPAFAALGRLMAFTQLPTVAGVVCIICVIVLLSGKLLEREYHLAILPMAGYAAAVTLAWAAGLTTPGGTRFSFGSAAILWAIWMLFYVAGVKLPEGGSDERTDG